MALEAFTGFEESDWSPEPDDVKVFRVCAEPTAQGAKCLVHVVLDYTRSGVSVGKRKLTLSPGFVGDNDFDKTTFDDFWNMVPDVDQGVKDAIMEKLPKAVLKQLWEGRKPKED